MGCCGDASNWAKVGFLMIFCATALHGGGYFTNNWMTYNTVMNLYDLRVGLWWFTNCSGGVTCNTETVPTQYESCGSHLYLAGGEYPDGNASTITMTLVRALEGGGGGILFVCMLASGFYIATERCRTRAVAIFILIGTILAAGSSIAGIVLWILHIVSPYYPAWSMGLCALGASLTLISTFCVIPDIKENKYDPKSIAVHPDSDYSKVANGKTTNDEIHPRPSESIVTNHNGQGYKNSSELGKEYGRSSRVSYPKRENTRISNPRRENTRDFDPYAPRKIKKDPFENDRFELEIKTPTKSPHRFN